MTYKYQNQEWLREMYVEKRLTQTEIARRCGVSQRTISRYLQHFGIRRPHQDEDWLHEKYVEDRLSMTEIAEICDVTSPAISYRIAQSDIESEGINGERNPSRRSV